MKILKDKKGGIVDFLLINKYIAMPLLITFFSFMIFFLFRFQFFHAKNITLDAMEKYGGYCSTVAAELSDFCDDSLLDYSNLSVSATAATQNYGTELYLDMNYNFTINVFFTKHTITFTERGMITSEYSNR